MLPDDDLLGIFDFCVIEGFRPSENRRIEEWETLAHVCRRWRSLIFQSPRRLNLRLLCTPNTRVRDTLDVWPPFPLVISDVRNTFDGEPSRVDNVIAALEHNDRVCQIQFNYFMNSELEYVVDSPAMHKPFPKLTDLQLGIEDDGPGPILPDSFLGGTAPRLRSLELDCIPFPGLPKLLLSATHLVKLDLIGIYPSRYIPPQAMATSLSALKSLEFLRLHFLSSGFPALESRPPPPPPLTRSILPSLTKILFEGASEYLEEILAGIDAPRLNEMIITFFDEIMFNTPRPFRFASRSPTLRALEKGHIILDSLFTIVRLSPQTPDHGDDVLIVEIPYTELGWTLSSLKQVCTSSLPSVSTLKDLYIRYEDPFRRQDWQDDVENTLWLELLHPFAALKNLYICKEFVPRIVPALQELVGGRTTEVLPTLENLFLEGIRPSGPLLEAIEKFVAARRLTNHPVAVSRWERGTEIHDW
jgi:hypothetical protein